MSSGGEIDFFKDNPIAKPLTYPGRIPDNSGILIDDSFYPLENGEQRNVEDWLVEYGNSLITLAELLGRLRSKPLSARLPVVAVGSNASPSQMLRKFVSRSVRPVVPMTLADIHGMAPGFSAHVSTPGYIPAVPVEMSGKISRLFVLWLDDQQLQVLDATEPNYWRRILPTDRFPVNLVSGVQLHPCFIYVGKHGYLVDPAGRPRPLTDQRSLITELLAESPELQKLCGRTPEEFVIRAQDPAVRQSVCHLFGAEKRAQAQPGLADLPSASSPCAHGRLTA
jgi:hypothetical protein